MPLGLRGTREECKGSSGPSSSIPWFELHLRTHALSSVQTVLKQRQPDRITPLFILLAVRKRGCAPNTAKQLGRQLSVALDLFLAAPPFRGSFVGASPKIQSRT